MLLGLKELGFKRRMHSIFDRIKDSCLFVCQCSFLGLFLMERGGCLEIGAEGCLKDVLFTDVWVVIGFCG